MVRGRRAQGARDRRAAARARPRPPSLVERPQHRRAAVETARRGPRRRWTAPRAAPACTSTSAPRGLLEVLGEHVMGSAARWRSCPASSALTRRSQTTGPRARMGGDADIDGRVPWPKRGGGGGGRQEMADREKLERAPEGEGLPATKRIERMTRLKPEDVGGLIERLTSSRRSCGDHGPRPSRRRHAPVAHAPVCVPLYGARVAAVPITPARGDLRLRRLRGRDPQASRLRRLGRQRSRTCAASRRRSSKAPTWCSSPTTIGSSRSICVRADASTTIPRPPTAT